MAEELNTNETMGDQEVTQEENLEAQEEVQQEAQETPEEEPKDTQETPEEDTNEQEEEDSEDVPLKLDDSEEEPKEIEQTDDIMNDIRALATKENLEESDYEKFKTKGYSKEMVDLAFRGMKSTIKENSERLYKEVGGKDKFKEIAEWANKNLDKAEKEEFNSIMESGDLKNMKWALRGLHNTYNNSNKNTRVVKGSSKTSGVKPFKNMREMVEAQKDERYGKDPEYMKEFDNRLRKSNF